MTKKYNKHMIKEVENIVKDFTWHRVSWQDREYIVNHVHETINSKNYRAKGGSFEDQYPESNDYALFSCKKAAQRYSDEFFNSDMSGTHLLTPHPKGRKYWFVWSYTKK